MNSSCALFCLVREVMSVSCSGRVCIVVRCVLKRDTTQTHWAGSRVNCVAIYSSTASQGDLDDPPPVPHWGRGPRAWDVLHAIPRGRIASLSAEQPADVLHPYDTCMLAGCACAAKCSVLLDCPIVLLNWIPCFSYDDCAQSCSGSLVTIPLCPPQGQIQLTF